MKAFLTQKILSIQKLCLPLHCQNKKQSIFNTKNSEDIKKHSRIATLIVGRVTEPMMEAVSLPPKEVKPLVFRGNELSLPYG